MLQWLLLNEAITKFKHDRVLIFFITNKKWIKKMQRLVILILKNINFTATKNLSIQDKVSSSGKNYIGNIDDDYKIKLFNKIRPKQGYILLKLNACFS